MESLPLTGLTVLDLSVGLAGGYCTMTLADLGATVIRLEQQATEQHSDVESDGLMPAAWRMTLHRNKLSLLLATETVTGRELLLQLLDQADGYVCDQPASVLSSLGIDYEGLVAANPGLVGCHISGYGRQGPACQRRDDELFVQAAGGGMTLAGRDSSNPTRAGIPIGHLGGGIFACMGMMAAFQSRHRTGFGQQVDIAMLDVQLSLLNYMATMYFMNGEDQQPMGNSHFVHVPYNSYPTRDGHLIIACITDQFWQNLKEIVSCPNFDDSRYDHQPGRLAAKAFIDKTLSGNISAANHGILVTASGGHAYSLCPD